eukprot:2289034-Ditylum_brightwellii.AAC.1
MSGVVNFGAAAYFRRNFYVGVGVFCTICVSGSSLWSTYFARAAHSQLCVSSIPVSPLPPLLL